jgi:c-di-GMP-binding flagellar brake protein YcgR
MDSSYSTERRQSERANCVLRASYCLPGRKLRVSETKNLSDGGVMLMVSGDVKKNDTIEIKIPLGPGEDALLTRGRVVHVQQEDSAVSPSQIAGVAFMKLSEEQQEAIGRKVWQQILREATRFGKIN